MGYGSHALRVPVNTDPATSQEQESLLALFGLNDPSLTLFVHV